MADVVTIMREFYNVLYKLRYPKITQVEPENIASIIFTGENRISLLSWLLAEKIPHIATILGKLEGPTLEDELAKYYSQLGICINKDILLGKCTLEAQLPTLTLLLEFIKNVHVDTIDISNSRTESIANLITEYLTENADTNNLDNVIPKTKSQVANKSEKLKKGSESYSQDKTSTAEELSSNDIKLNDNERKENFISQMDKFIDAYKSVSSWPTSNMKIKNTKENDLNTCIKNIHSDFTVLKQVLHMTNEIPKLAIKEPPERNTPLNSIVEDMVTSIDEDFSKM